MHKNPVLYSVLFEVRLFPEKSPFWGNKQSFFVNTTKYCGPQKNFFRNLFKLFMRGYDKNIQRTRRRLYGRVVSKIRIENRKVDMKEPTKTIKI